jgi:hypothetical protein
MKVALFALIWMYVQSADPTMPATGEECVSCWNGNDQKICSSSSGQPWCCEKNDFTENQCDCDNSGHVSELRNCPADQDCGTTNIPLILDELKVISKCISPSETVCPFVLKPAFFYGWLISVTVHKGSGFEMEMYQD